MMRTPSDAILPWLQDRLRRHDTPCVALARAFVRVSGVDPADPLAVALVAVAAAAGRSGVANAFHNPAHTREVAANWWLLARLQVRMDRALPQRIELIGLIAAFGHDIGHDGHGDASDPAGPSFRLEAIAADTVDAILRQAGVDAAGRGAVSAIILTTDVREGHAHLTGAPLGDPRFAALGDEDVMLAARILRDADLLPSAGTSIVAYRARTAELERELAVPAGTLSAADFFDGVVEWRFLSPAGQVFADRLGHIAAAAGA